MRIQKNVGPLAAGILLALFSCRQTNPGTTSVGNPVPPRQVTFGALTEDGRVAVSIPPAAFGEPESGLSGASLRVFKNGAELISSLPATDVYDSARKTVEVDVHSLTAKDVLSVLLFKETERVFSATVGPGSARTRNAVACDSTESGAERLACALCERVSICGEALSRPSCLSLLLSAACEDPVNCDRVQLGDEFGVPVPKNSISMEGMAEGVEAGIFSADPGKLNACVDAISGLTCGEVVPAGYDPSDPDALIRLEDIIPGPSCGDVYGTPGGL